MEFIFVDDCSPDHSVEILSRIIEEYPQRKNQIRILRNQRNRGQLQTRSLGQLSAQGEYIASVDSDDWVETNAYEMLYRKAIEDNADAVIFGYHRDFERYSELCRRVFPYSNGKNFLTHAYQFPFEFFTWGTLVRNDSKLKDILHQFYDNKDWENVTMWEDVAVMFQLYYVAKRISYSDHYFYHYNRTNIQSAVNTQNINKIKESYQVLDYLVDKYKEDPTLKLTLNNMMFGAKSPLIEIDGIKAWRNEHKACNRYLLYYRSIPLKIRLYYLSLLIGFTLPYHLRKKLSK
jgi:glycosyltransferase involved in cell wall biosynthesis